MITKKTTIRQLLQIMGTEALREQIHPNIHVAALFADYKPQHEPSTIDKLDNRVLGNSHIKYSNWIITDCRFPNEAQAIKDRGGIIVRINRPLNDNIDKALKGIISTHPSETSLDNYSFNYTIDNSGTIEELIQKVKEILLTEKIIT